MQFPFFGNKKQKRKLYLGLFLKENAGIAFVFEKKDGMMTVIEKENFDYSNAWENVLEDVDEVLFKLENKLKTHLTDCIFFVYSHFIDENTNEIKKNYLTKIKELVKNLEFKPLGYIECIDAVVSYIEGRDEMPITSVLAEFDTNNIGVFIYKGGREVAKKIVARTDSITEDFLTAFSAIKNEMLLPSRIILYNSSDLGTEATKILTYHWGEEFFIQLPKIEILKEDEVHAGLTSVFGSQVAGGTVTVTTSIQKHEGQDSVENNQAVSLNEEQGEENKEVMGFVIGQDVGEEQDDGTTLQEPHQNTNVSPKKSKLNFGPVLNFFKKIHLPSFNLPNFKAFPQKANILIGILVILLAIFLEEFFLHTATLTLIAPTQKITSSEKIVGELGSSSGDIVVTVSSSSAEFSEKKSATGKKDIGTKAKGTVTLYNFTSSDKQFPAGTTITTDNIKFVLESDVSASAAATVVSDSGPVRKPGSVKAKVTASDIGPQANVDRSRQFTVGNSSSESYLAIADSAFLGGSKKQIQTVSKKDLDDLENTVISQAKNKGLNGQASTKGEDRVFPDLTEMKISKTKFSKEIGEEAETVGLAATVTTTFYIYNKDDLLKFLMTKTKTQVAPGYVLTPRDINYSFDKTKKTGENLELQLSITAIAKKNISEEEVRAKMIFRSKKEVSAVLQNTFGLAGYSLNIDQKLPFMQDRMPIFKKNIKLKISTSD